MEPETVMLKDLTPGTWLRATVQHVREMKWIEKISFVVGTVGIAVGGVVARLSIQILGGAAEKWQATKDPLFMAVFAVGLTATLFSIIFLSQQIGLFASGLTGPLRRHKEHERIVQVVHEELAKGAS